MLVLVSMMPILSKTNKESPFKQIFWWFLWTWEQILDSNERYFYHFQLNYERCKKNCRGQNIEKSQPNLLHPTTNKHPLHFKGTSNSVLNPPSNFVCLCVGFVNSQLIWSVILSKAILITTTTHTNTHYCKHNTVGSTIICHIFFYSNVKHCQRHNGPRVLSL